MSRRMLCESSTTRILALIRPPRGAYRSRISAQSWSASAWREPSGEGTGAPSLADRPAASSCSSVGRSSRARTSVSRSRTSSTALMALAKCWDVRSWNAIADMMDITRLPTCWLQSVTSAQAFRAAGSPLFRNGSSRASAFPSRSRSLPSPSASSSTLLAAISVAWMSPVRVKVIEGSVCFEMGMRLATAAWSRLRIARWHCPRLTSRSVALTESEFRPGSPLVVDRSSLVMSGPLSSGFIALELLSQSGAVLPGTGGSSRSGLRGTVQDLLDLRRQDIGLERLHDVPVDVGLDGLDDVLFLIGRGDHEDRQLRMLRARADRLDQF